MITDEIKMVGRALLRVGMDRHSCGAAQDVDMPALSVRHTNLPGDTLAMEPMFEVGALPAKVYLSARLAAGTIASASFDLAIDGGAPATEYEAQAVWQRLCAAAGEVGLHVGGPSCRCMGCNWERAKWRPELKVLAGVHAVARVAS